MQKDFISGFLSFASFYTNRIPKLDFGSEKSSSSVIPKISQNSDENIYETCYTREYMVFLKIFGIFVNFWYFQTFQKHNQNCPI